MYVKGPIFSVLSSIFGQIGTFWCKSRPFPDQFLQKRVDADKNSKKTLNQIEAQIRCPSDIEFVWVVKLLGVLAHFHVKPNLG